MDDEEFSGILAAIGVLWMLGGLFIAAMVVQLLRAWGVSGVNSPGVGMGLLVYHFVVVSIIASYALFFRLRGALRSGGLVAAFLAILQALMSFLCGAVFWQLLKGWMMSKGG
jgi:hypothetical protein